MGFIGIADNEYGDHVLEQMVKFPGGKHDDAVDMAAFMARVIDEAHPMITVPGIPVEKKDRYDRAWDDDYGDGDNWKTA